MTRHGRRANQGDTLSRAPCRQRLVASAAVGSGSNDESSFKSAVEGVKKFVQAQFLPLGLVAGMLAGVAAPAAGMAAAELGAPTFATAGIFLLSGEELDDDRN